MSNSDISSITPLAIHPMYTSIGSVPKTSALIITTLVMFFSATENSFAASADSQTYPTKALRFIVPFTPGGGADLLARMVALKAAENLGQQIVIDNRPGAGGNIGAEIAAQSPADGYTLLEANVSHAISASLYKKLNYDLIKDFSAVTQLASTSFMLTLTPGLPVSSVKDLITTVKTQSRQINYGSAGSGSPSHLAMELFKSMAGITARHIPYKGATPALTDLMSGEIQMMFNTLAVAVPHVKGGKLKGLAVSSNRRVPVAPDYPTIAESGLPGYEATTWYGVMLPAGTPSSIVARLQKTFVAALNSPELRDRLTSQSFEIVGSNSSEFAAYVRVEIPKWAKVVKSSNAKSD